MNEPIYVTKTFLPPIEEYEEYLHRIWKNGQITNEGQLVKNFEGAFEKKLGLKNFHFIANGTLALQIALRALDITTGEVITTPFSYVATTSSILWQSCRPVFVDIDPDSLCIDPKKIEAMITPKTKAIIPVHVFGNPCDVEAIEKIAIKHKLKVIYDAAHAYGVEYQGKSLFEFGDISTCSFHATKLMHTIEGGGIITKDKDISSTIDLMKRFGHQGDEHILLGINAKASEMNAAMGLINLKHVDELIQKRKIVSELYDQLLPISCLKVKMSSKVTYNYAYYPILMETEELLLKTIEKLQAHNIFPRRYFYPSLNKLPYLKSSQDCPIAEDISSRIMCLPLYAGMSETTVSRICEVIEK